jgi:hypothetical protein
MPAVAPPPPPRRQGRTRLVVAISTAVTVTVAICVGLALVNKHPAQPAGTPQTRTHDQVLTAYLSPAPADSHPWRTKPSSELLDLDGMAQLGANPTARAGLLRRYGFQRAAIGRWVSSIGSIVEIQLYQFDSTTDASNFFRADVLADTIGSWGSPTGYGGVPGAQTFTKSTIDNSGYAESLDVASAGDLTVAVVILQHPPAVASEGQSILADQYALL